MDQQLTVYERHKAGHQFPYCISKFPYCVSSHNKAVS